MLVDSDLGDREQRSEVGERPYLDSVDRSELLERRRQRPKVPTMGREEDDAPEAAARKRPHEVGNNSMKRVLGNRDRPRELEMMLRAPNPDRRRHERIQVVSDQPSEVISEQRIGGQRQVRTMLLGGAEGDDHGVPTLPELLSHVLPRHPVQRGRAHRAPLVRSRFTYPEPRAIAAARDQQPGV